MMMLIFFFKEKTRRIVKQWESTITHWWKCP